MMSPTRSVVVFFFFSCFFLVTGGAAVGTGSPSLGYVFTPISERGRISGAGRREAERPVAKLAGPGRRSSAGSLSGRPLEGDAAEARPALRHGAGGSSRRCVRRARGRRGAVASSS